MAAGHPDTSGRIPDGRLNLRATQRDTTPAEPTPPTDSSDTDTDNPHRDTPGHPQARGTPANGAALLLDLATETEDEIQPPRRRGRTHERRLTRYPRPACCASIGAANAPRDR
ncbi:hypothetical protein GCM10009827_056950 [Dactylosporangium maewongense]|uniref:Uncharacterized protein n=1 Tax=Dactylosporangium maewongense TaxID=634393 RepID=A0ABN2B2E7_9ACTN